MKHELPIILNGKRVEKITAFLFHAGGNDDPERLLANSGKSFQGSIVLGMGFTFDNSNPDATSIEEMQHLIEKDPKNKECIFPYIGGAEVNSSPTHTHHRYVINFGEMSEDEARNYPDLMSIVEKKVKPERDVQKRDALRIKWWQYAEKRPGLVKAIAPLDRVLVIPRTSKHFVFTFLPNQMVYSENIVVFTLQQNSFPLLQSRIHEIWVRFFSSTLKDDLAYRPSDCFETFPFPSPPNPESNGRREPEGETEGDSTQPPLLKGEPEPKAVMKGGSLEEVGQIYYEYRAALMIKNNQGLTETYNRFHDPREDEPEILKLRALHASMDSAVLDAYGWSDVDYTCGFALDYLDLDPEELPTEVQERIASGDLFFPTAQEAINFNMLISTGKKKLPWRYRHPESIHDEILARLLDLNQKRAEEEKISGKSAEHKEKTKGTKKPKSQKTTKVDQRQIELFSSQE